ncbi:TetR/AcrR family transcriptional regulator [Phytohabitans kaempferiae]|uniref:TetR/AcrR family transcriptional regulator n=1 Tax=Phytohabitans kaempferiae TaxID=1620943 RepID=A0ABV6M9T9_9ACTN
MTDTKRNSAETEAQIYAEARRLFNLKGYVGMTLREIAAGVGIEAQSLYNYTKSKQDLVVALMRQGTVAIQEAVDKAVAAADPAPTAQLWAATFAHTQHYCSSEKVVLVREGLVHLSADRRADIVGLLKRYEDTFKDILRRGMEADEFRPLDVTPTCFAILGMGESVVNWFNPGRRLSATDVARMYADLAVRSVARPTA